MSLAKRPQRLHAKKWLKAKYVLRLEVVARRMMVAWQVNRYDTDPSSSSGLAAPRSCFVLLEMSNGPLDACTKAGAAYLSLMMNRRNTKPSMNTSTCCSAAYALVPKLVNIWSASWLPRAAFIFWKASTLSGHFPAHRFLLGAPSRTVAEP